METVVCWTEILFLFSFCKIIVYGFNILSLNAIWCWPYLVVARACFLWFPSQLCVVINMFETLWTSLKPKGWKLKKGRQMDVYQEPYILCSLFCNNLHTQYSFEIVDYRCLKVGCWQASRIATFQVMLHTTNKSRKMFTHGNWLVCGSTKPTTIIPCTHLPRIVSICKSLEMAL